MPELPAFLADFISHRKNVVKSKPDEKKKVLKGVGVTKNETFDTSVDGIIDKKPGPKVVKEYFQKKCEELSTAKMK